MAEVSIRELRNHGGEVVVRVAAGEQIGRASCRERVYVQV
jgi:antitoxin (DNA-binding transcriptional repressor) of toxin-antitoxin stability system